MKVWQLIKDLQRLDPQREVVIYDVYYGWNPVRSTEELSLSFEGVDIHGDWYEGYPARTDENPIACLGLK